MPRPRGSRSSRSADTVGPSSARGATSTSCCCTTVGSTSARSPSASGTRSGSRSCTWATASPRFATRSPRRRRSRYGDRPPLGAAGRGRSCAGRGARRRSARPVAEASEARPVAARRARRAASREGRGGRVPVGARSEGGQGRAARRPHAPVGGGRASDPVRRRRGGARRGVRDAARRPGRVAASDVAADERADDGAPGRGRRFPRFVGRRRADGSDRRGRSERSRGSATTRATTVRAACACEIASRSRPASCRARAAHLDGSEVSFADDADLQDPTLVLRAAVSAARSSAVIERGSLERLAAAASPWTDPWRPDARLPPGRARYEPETRRSL